MTLRFMHIFHDPHCLALDTEKMTDCTCKAEFKEVSESDFSKENNINRAQRRKAAREAAKAVRKAKK
jgi:hypothetical protein